MAFTAIEAGVFVCATHNRYVTILTNHMCDSVRYVRNFPADITVLIQSQSEIYSFGRQLMRGALGMVKGIRTGNWSFGQAYPGFEGIRSTSHGDKGQAGRGSSRFAIQVSRGYCTVAESGFSPI